MQPQLKLSIKKITQLRNAVVLCISADLPFAQQRFCAVEGIRNIEMLSTFRNSDFSEHYGVGITSDALAGLNARAILV